MTVIMGWRALGLFRDPLGWMTIKVDREMHWFGNPQGFPRYQFERNPNR